ncbi:MAG TPA: hypothetical protein VEX60_16910 [Pyrinomonadaceae bacterium]|nr:hypothetical protein [Pyrinomonadaceae bacterium]
MLRAMLANINASALAFCAAITLSLTLSSNAFAQTPAPGLAPSPARSESQTRGRADQSTQRDAADAQADLSITARVTARELRFEKVPNPKVEFTGQPRRETVWEAERENLPDEVQPGVTYRNVGITLRITSVFADIERIVAEALGEIPLSDDAQPRSATPEQRAAPPAMAQSNAPPTTSDSPARQTNGQRINASNSSPLNAPAVPTPQRPRPARKGRRN